MEQSTQWGVSLPNIFPMKKHLKSRNPALNIPRKQKIIQSAHNKVTKSHSVGTRLFPGFLVSFASGVVERNCWMKQQSNTQKQGALTAIQTGCLGALPGSQSLTALNR